MNYIDFVVRNKHIESRQNAIIADNTDYMMRFAFDEGWDGYPDKTVLVLDNEGKIWELHLTGGETEVKLPKFIGRKLLAVGVTATAGDGEISSDALSLRVNPSIRTGASEVIGAPESGAKDLLEEYREKYETLIAELQAAIDSTYLGVTGATVGQTVRITAVDEGGKPTEWEAVEFPEQVQSDWEQTDETAADYMKNRPFGNVAYDGIFFKRVPGGYNLVRVPDFNALAEIQGTRKAEIRRYGDVVNTGSADVSVSDYDGSISIKYTSAQTIIRFSGSYGTLNSINVQQDSGISNEGEYVLHIDGLYYEGYIKLSADKVEGTLPSASAADCVLISTGSGNNWRATKISTDFPLASATGRGAVKVGDGLSISSDGKLSVDMSGLDTKSLGISGASVGQIVKIKTVDSSGVPTEWEPADMPSGSGGSTDTSLGVTGAEVGQIVKIKAVDESGAPTEWESVSGGDEWTQLCEVELTEATNAISQTWVDTPMRKIKVSLTTLAASANTSYMPARVSTEPGTTATRYATFYPTALPIKSGKSVEYIAEVYNVSGNVHVRFTEHYGGIYGNKSGSTGGAVRIENVKSAESTGNDPYGNGLYEQIIGFSVQTYGTFEVGTKLKIWGVAL